MFYLIILLILLIAVIIGLVHHFKEKIVILKREIELERENSANLAKYQDILDIDNELKTKAEHLQLVESANSAFQKLEEIVKQTDNVTQEYQKQNNYLETIKTQIETSSDELNFLKSELGLLEPEKELLSFGFYHPKYSFSDSRTFKKELESIKTGQKEQIKNGHACYCSTEWTVGSSKAEGTKMIKRQIKMTLRAFNGESDACISNVSYSNILSNERKIKKSFEAINKLNESQQVVISPAFLRLKLEEMFLKFEYELKLQEEKEEQRAIKEQMREEEKVQKEIEKAKRESEKEQARYCLGSSKSTQLRNNIMRF